jgi:hypothetical protein
VEQEVVVIPFHGKETIMNQDEIRNDNPPSDPNWLWKGPRTDFPRDPAAADKARREHFANLRETAVAAPPAENAMALANAWGASYGMVQRLVAIQEKVAAQADEIKRHEEVIASLAGGIVVLQNAFDALAELVAAQGKSIHSLLNRRTSR